MKNNISALSAHLMATGTIIVWGTTFIASKLLLAVYTPSQIMLMRFALAYVMLFILKPKVLRMKWKEELYFALLGLIGCTVYFLAENNALKYTLASNVSIIVAAAPMFTAILANFILPDEKLHSGAFLGFAIAIVGVALVVFNGTVVLKLNPLGDILSLLAAMCWALYSVLLKRRVNDYDSLQLTRRVMLWGFITSLPLTLAEGKPFTLAPLADPKLLFCVLFLGLLGSALGYFCWNLVSRRLGIVVVNNYVYVNPLATTIAAAIILKENISLMGAVGAVLILLGVFVSDRRKTKKEADV